MSDLATSQIGDLVATHTPGAVMREVCGVRAVSGAHLMRVGMVVRPVHRSGTARAHLVSCPPELSSKTLVNSVVRGGITGPPLIVGPDLCWRCEYDVRRSMPSGASVMHGAHRQPVSPRPITVHDLACGAGVSREERSGRAQCLASIEPVVVGLAQLLPAVLHRTDTSLNATFHAPTLSQCNDCNMDHIGGGDGA